jgi:hypothetical protein
MQITVTPQEEVRHHSPVNRMKYKGCRWERRKVNPQTTKEEDQKDISWARMGTPHPCTDTVGGNDWRTTCKEKDWCRDDDRVLKSTHSEIVKKDQKVHLYRRPMITRIILQSGKPLKRRSIRDSYIPASNN